jgi:hypothetical protein
MLLSHSFAKNLTSRLFWKKGGGHKINFHERLLHAVKINAIKSYNIILNVNVAGMGQTTRLAMYAQTYTEARSRYLLLSWKSKIITYTECVSVALVI